VCVQPGGCQTLPFGADAPAPDPNQTYTVTGGQLSALKSSFLADALRTFLQTMLGVLALMALLSMGWVGWLAGLAHSVQGTLGRLGGSSGVLSCAG
jgi:hypothetical protein